MLFKFLKDLLGGNTVEKRQAIVDTARAEAAAQQNNVFAKLSGGKDFADPQKRDFCRGYQQLLKYFRLSAPAPGQLNKTVFNEDPIIHLINPGKVEPMPHWCGIFAVWAIKTAGVKV